MHRCHLLVRLMSSRLHRSRTPRTATGPVWEGLRLARMSGIGPQGETTWVGVGRSSGGWTAIQGEAYQEAWAAFLLPSDLVAWSDATRRFAGGLIVSPDGGVASWARQLAAALNSALVYERGATDVTTAVDGVIASERGVCQDFAHVFIALCRLRGVAARYVSGWMFEADRDGPVESHAWAEVNVPGIGWVEEDPTHVGEVSDRYVRIACGRDYSDVVPIKGTYLGGMTESMEASVELREVI